LYGQVLKFILEEEEKLSELEQSGFRAERSRIVIIFCLVQAVEKRMAVGMDTKMFIDV
jgi:hypothetical protein